MAKHHTKLIGYCPASRSGWTGVWDALLSALGIRDCSPVVRKQVGVDIVWDDERIEVGPVTLWFGEELADFSRESNTEALK